MHIRGPYPGLLDSNLWAVCNFNLSTHSFIYQVPAVCQALIEALDMPGNETVQIPVQGGNS